MSCTHVSNKYYVNLMYIGACIIVIVEEKETILMPQVIKFYLTSSVLNMFRTLIHRSSVACGGIRVAG